MRAMIFDGCCDENCDIVMRIVIFCDFLDRGQLILIFCEQGTHALPCAMTMPHDKGGETLVPV